MISSSKPSVPTFYTEINGSDFSDDPFAPVIEAVAAVRRAYPNTQIHGVAAIALVRTKLIEAAEAGTIPLSRADIDHITIEIDSEQDSRVNVMLSGDAPNDLRRRLLADRFRTSGGAVND